MLFKKILVSPITIIDSETFDLKPIFRKVVPIQEIAAIQYYMPSNKSWANAPQSKFLIFNKDFNAFSYITNNKKSNLPIIENLFDANLQKRIACLEEAAVKSILCTHVVLYFKQIEKEVSQP